MKKGNIIKGVFVFYLVLIICVYISIWRFEKLEEKVIDPLDKVAIKIN